MLFQAAAGTIDRVGGDDQQPIDAGEAGIQRIGIVEIDTTRLDAEIGKPGGIARAGDKSVAGRSDQGFEREAAKLAGGASDE